MLIQGGQGKDTPKEKRAAEKVVAESELLPENSSELEIVQFVLDRAGERPHRKFPDCLNL